MQQIIVLSTKDGRKKSYSYTNRKIENKSKEGCTILNKAEITKGYVYYLIKA